MPDIWPELPRDHWIIRSNGEYTRGDVDVLQAEIIALMPVAECSRERDWGYTLECRYGDVTVTAVQPERRDHLGIIVVQERIFRTAAETVSMLRSGTHEQGGLTAAS